MDRMLDHYLAFFRLHLISTIGMVLHFFWMHRVLMGLVVHNGLVNKK